MYKIIDRADWERKDNFAFFEEFLDPTASVTSRIDCTGVRQRAKERGYSFFLCYLYAALKAINQIENWRYRIDPENRIRLYDQVDMLTPIKIPGRTFFTVRIPYTGDFQQFHAKAREIIGSIPADGDPYQAEQSGGDLLDVVLLSATPDLWFSSVTYTQKSRHGSDYPLMNVGKTYTEEGREYFPMGICFHHGFVDGEHVAGFFHLVEKNLAELF